MESEFTITTYDYWKNTIRSVEAAYCWLTSYEGKDYELVEESVTSMRKLLAHGKDYEAMKIYKSNSSNKNTPTTTTYTTPYQKKHNSFIPVPINWDLEPNWQQLDNNTIQIDFGNNLGKAIAIAVTTGNQLDEMIKEIYKSGTIAVDCEFLGVKNALPELKLLQIGISKEKGYAIQIDIIGNQLISDKLKSVLEDESLNIIGWSFRPDALAIESYIKTIELAPVLDLQAKLKPIAVETLNLAAAMNRFASKWVGNEEFQKAKQCGNQFHYTGDDCVWLKNPLPPKALVYGVFDVLSVFALNEFTSNYNSAENHYWPFTVISDSSQKSIEKWHRQRAKGINTPYTTGTGQGAVVGIVKSRAPLKTSYRKEKSPSTIITKTDDGYNDEDIRYQRDIQVALERSVKEAYGGVTSSHGESSGSNYGVGSGGDRIVSEEVVDQNSSLTLSEMAAELDSNPYNRRFFEKLPEKVSSNVPEVIESTWGMEVLDKQPFIGGKFQFSNKAANSNATAAAAIQESQSASPDIAATTVTASASPQHEQAYPARPYRERKQLYTPFSRQNISIPPQEQKYSLKAPYNRSPQYTDSKVIQVAQESTSSDWVSVDPENVTIQDDNNQQKQGESNTTGQRSNASANTQWGHKNSNAVQPTTSRSDVNGNIINNKSSTTGPWSNDVNQWNKTNTTLSNNIKRASNTTSNNNNNNNNASQRQFSRPQTQESSYRSPRPTSWNNSPQQPQQPPNTQSPSKPDKVKYTNDFKNRIAVGNQGGEFTWSQTVGSEMSTASWKTFASTTVNDWGQGKDTALDAIVQPITGNTTATTTSNGSPASSNTETIKFNTTVQSHYPRGGNIGDSSTGSMHNTEEQVDNWTLQEERPDTMKMPMNQIPIRTTFSGPRIMNPHDGLSDEDEDEDEDEDDDHDHDHDHDYDYDIHDSDFPILKVNMSIQDNKQRAQKNTGGVENLATYVDGKFLYSDDGNGELAMLCLTTYEHLDMINIPPPGTDFTVTICYHFVSRKDTFELKALQLYLSTGESYTCLVESACVLKDRDTIINTKFGRLITEPNIKRICWCPAYIEYEMIQKLGFPIGRCVDLSERANYERDDNEILTFIAATDHYLKDWPDKNQFVEAKADFDISNSKKFSSTCWDRQKLPDAVLTYSALQGLTANALYIETLKRIDASDEWFIYELNN